MMNLRNLFAKHRNNVVIKDNEQIATIKVTNNGYEPQVTKLQKDIPAKLFFNRTNESMCLAQVQSQVLSFQKDLPLQQDVVIPIKTNQAGEFDYACGMNMFHGKVMIK